MSLRRTAALVLATAILYFLAFPPFPTGFLAALFLLPFFRALEGAGFRRGFRLGYAAGLLSIGGLLYWLSLNKGSSLGEAAAMHAGTAIYLAFAWGAFGLLLAFVCRRFGRAGLWSAPFLWTAMEFVQAHGSLGFTWHSIATTQASYAPAIQFISATGMFGLSCWLVLLNVLAYRALCALLESPPRRLRGPAPRFAAIALVVAAAPVVHGLLAAPGPGDPARGLRVAIAQPSDDSRGKWTRRNLSYQHLMKLTMALEEGYDLVVWPETAVPFVLREEPRRARAIREVLAAKGAVLLAGISDKRANAGAAAGGGEGRSRADKIKESRYRKVNTVHLVRPDSEALETYEKLHLVPFGEYVPPFLGFLEDMMMNVGSGVFVPGTEVRVFDVPVRGAGGPSIKAGAVICLESNFPQLVGEFVDRGARLLVVVANDEWYLGSTEAYQHAAIARLRAAEHRLPVLRASNGGISAIIDPAGRVTAEAGPGVEAIVAGRVALGPGPSFYSRHGDWFPWAALAAALLALAWTAASGLAARRRAR